MSAVVWEGPKTRPAEIHFVGAVDDAKIVMRQEFPGCPIVVQVGDFKGLIQNADELLMAARFFGSRMQ